MYHGVYVCVSHAVHLGMLWYESMLVCVCVCVCVRARARVMYIML